MSDKYCDWEDTCKLVKQANAQYNQVVQQNISLQAELREYKENEKWSGLYDTCGKKIMYGNVVHWTDGGDELPLEERIKERWDRIATVEKNVVEIEFHVFDSPNEWTKNYQQTFRYGAFIYTDTEKYLTVVAESKEEYHKKFKNAGECMAYVLELRGINKERSDNE